jgi:hypothetical protein
VNNFLYSNLDTNKYDNGNISIENRKVFAELINENMTYKNCPVVLANSIELQGMVAKTAKESVALKKIKENEEVKALLPK